MSIVRIEERFLGLYTYFFFQEKLLFNFFIKRERNESGASNERYHEWMLVLVDNFCDYFKNVYESIGSLQFNPI
jgi:hypothetical protein